MTNFIINGDVLVKYIADEHTAIVPNVVRKIESDAFENKKNLEVIIFPESVNEIANGAVCNCKKLKYVAVYSIQTEISVNSFLNCNDFELFAPIGSVARKFAEKVDGIRVTVNPVPPKEIISKPQSQSMPQPILQPQPAPKQHNAKKPKALILFLIAFAVIAAIVVIAFTGEGLAEETNTTKLSTKGTTIAMQNTENATKSIYSETQATPTTIATTVDAGKLYRPSTEKFCNQYTRYISGAFEGQGYAKMRFGPSKSKYNVVGQIDNGNIVTVETVSVDGWTLIYYAGLEGWVRTDFLFEDYEDCFPTKKVSPDMYYKGYIAGYVDVTGEYNGEPLNMRTGPSKKYDLITTVPDGAEIEIIGISHETEDWTYVNYKGNLGWILTKYIFY